MSRFILLLALQIGLTSSALGVRHGHPHIDRRRVERRQALTAAALLQLVCETSLNGLTSEDEASCRKFLAPQVDGSRQQYCNTACEEADECTSEQSNASLVCSNLSHWCDICDETVYDQYASCFRTGTSLAELATCVNDRLNLNPPTQSTLTTSTTTSSTNDNIEPMVVTTAIPFWSNGSIAYLSTTATIPLSAGLRTGPAPVITATLQMTASGLRTGALPAPPAFSQTGLWTNTTGSFASATIPASGGPAESQGNRNGTFFTSSSSSSPTLGTDTFTTATTTPFTSPVGDPGTTSLAASESMTVAAAQSTTGARVGGAYTSEGDLCTVHTVTLLVA